MGSTRDIGEKYHRSKDDSTTENEQKWEQEYKRDREEMTEG